MFYGEGTHSYKLVDNWAKYPEGWYLLDVPQIAVDAKDRVYAINRGAHSVMIFDRTGKLLSSWGEGLFKRAHGIHVTPDGSVVYCTDDVMHTVRKFTHEGKLLLTMGKEYQPSDTGYMEQADFFSSQATIRFGPPFNRPTGIALSSTGDIYVCDGYGNARVHKFAPDGTLLFSWGEQGRAPGQFRLPHSVRVDKQDRVWVADRENHRIQIFDDKGEFITQWIDLQRPNDLYIDAEENVYVTGMGGTSIFSTDGKLLARCDNLKGHGIAVDSKGDIYHGTFIRTSYGVDGVNLKSRTLQKYAKIN
jgi:sugar lactone lactonase YvrE